MSRKKRKSSKNKLPLIFGIIIVISILALAGIWYCTHKAEVRAQLSQTAQKVEQTAQGIAQKIEQKFAPAADADETQPGVQPAPAQPAPQTDAKGSDSEPPVQPTGKTQPAEKPESAPTAHAAQVSPSPADDRIQLPPNLAVPKCAADAHAPDHELRHFTDYDICYRESYEQAEWAAYKLEKFMLVKNAKRKNDFRPDPKISTGSSTLSDYRNSGYDRGHLAPAADFTYTPVTLKETFFMSNMTPQAPQFNRGIWKDLEEQVRRWAEEYGRLYVICGPVLDEPAESYATIGENKIAIPRYFYKIVLCPVYADEADAATPDDCADLVAYAYIIPNKQCEDKFPAFSVTIDEIEARTGIDFFYALDDDVEKRIESTKR